MKTVQVEDDSSVQQKDGDDDKQQKDVNVNVENSHSEVDDVRRYAGSSRYGEIIGSRNVDINSEEGSDGAKT